jgi:hypothetical protein
VEAAPLNMNQRNDLSPADIAGILTMLLTIPAFIIAVGEIMRRRRERLCKSYRYRGDNVHSPQGQAKRR